MSLRHFVPQTFEHVSQTCCLNMPHVFQTREHVSQTSQDVSQTFQPVSQIFCLKQILRHLDMSPRHLNMSLRHLAGFVFFPQWWKHFPLEISGGSTFSTKNKWWKSPKQTKNTRCLPDILRFLSDISICLSDILLDAMLRCVSDT